MKVMSSDLMVLLVLCILDEEWEAQSLFDFAEWLLSFYEWEEEAKLARILNHTEERLDDLMGEVVDLLEMYGSDVPLEEFIKSDQATSVGVEEIM